MLGGGSFNPGSGSWCCRRTPWIRRVAPVPKSFSGRSRDKPHCRVEKPTTRGTDRNDTSPDPPHSRRVAEPRLALGRYYFPYLRAAWQSPHASGGDHDLSGCSRGLGLLRWSPYLRSRGKSLRLCPRSIRMPRCAKRLSAAATPGLPRCELPGGVGATWLLTAPAAIILARSGNSGSDSASLDCDLDPLLTRCGADDTVVHFPQ